MDQNHENSFWKSTVRTVPGRPSPKKDLKVIKGKTTATTASFENYQQSVNDAWQLSDDELTKEYCILSDDPKLNRRSTQNASRTQRNPQQIAVVHKASSSSTSSSSYIANNNIAPHIIIDDDETASSNANNNNNNINNIDDVDETRNKKIENEHQIRKSDKITSSGSSNIEYG